MTQDRSFPRREPGAARKCRQYWNNYFSAWFEAYLGGQWHIFDPRDNIPRVERLLMTQGRDAADVPLSNAFGPDMLECFKTRTDDVSSRQ